ncbi:hypothetical protein CROQUDRAFT_649765 [Cronartium quercuum f. sp. fusiforme G11]|uniref:Syntaxin n=1 Tax=Cronartium quercuum f. sp. fusiforme G11 TaxID=708437 RepID=A0A9P6NUV5_9BASI|nr:hypothetical protein CROQUDRAFT_649765 [Cronartium quercuum f. sp. fusiforme G11]
MIEIQSLYIKSYEVVTENNQKFVRYKIEVTTRLKSYVVRRRYSEFVQLRIDLGAELQRAHQLDRALQPGQKNSLAVLPVLPPKTRGVISYLTGSSSIADPATLLERQQALERWLKTIIVNKDLRAATASSPSLISFLEYERPPQAKPVNGAGDLAEPILFTPQAWLIEHNDLKAAIRDIYALLSERDQFNQRRHQNPASSSATTELLESNRLSVDAKRQLASVSSRVGNLLESLQQLSGPSGITKAGMSLSVGEVERRSKLLTSLQDECEKLRKLTVFAHTEAGVGLRNRIERPAEHADQRAELLGGGSRGRPTTRVLGGPATAVAEETATTRGLDNRGLMEYQVQTKMVEEQDSKLKSLTEILQRQKMLGMLINAELVEQNEILDDLGNEVDLSSRKLKDAKKKMDRLTG